MNEREITIAEAALRAYSRQGVKRTTMSQIATEASVTRQTVYNAFPNTDAVLRAAIRLFIARLWQTIRIGWETSDTLGEKLDILLHHFALVPWDFVNSSAEAAELERGYNAAGRAEIEAARLGFRGDIAALFTPFEQTLIARGTTPLALADYISAAIEGIKYNNDTKEDMLTAIATLRATLLAVTEDV